MMASDHVYRHNHFKKESSEQQELRQKTGFAQAGSPFSIDVPPSVLVTLRSHHQWLSKHKRRAEEGHSKIQDAEPRSTKKKKKVVQDTEPPSSSPERPISWTPSPPQPRQRPCAESRFDLRAAPTFSLPPSSVVNDNEFGAAHEEVVNVSQTQACMQSQALGLPQPSPDRLATPHRPQLAGTPTCAQPNQQVVPGTVLGVGSPSNLPVGKDVQPCKQPEPVRRRPRKMKQFDPAVLQGLEARNVVNPPTHRSNTGDSTSVSLQQGAQGGRTTLGRDNGDAVCFNDAVTDPARQDIQAPATRSESSEPIIPNVKTEEVSQPSLIAMTAFEAFVDRYPEYTVAGGSLSTFLMACITLEWAHDAQKLHQFLWDDFIRVFTMSYLPYVKNKRGSLGALEFYNDRAETPLWVPSQMVKLSTLGTILDFYRDRVRELRPRVIVDEENAHQPLGPSPDKITKIRASTPEIAAPVTPQGSLAEQQTTSRRYTLGSLPASNPPRRSLERPSTPAPSAEPTSSHSTPLSQLPYFKNLMQKGTPKEGVMRGQNVYRKMVQRKSTSSLPEPSV